MHHLYITFPYSIHTLSSDRSNQPVKQLTFINPHEKSLSTSRLPVQKVLQWGQNWQACKILLAGLAVFATRPASENAKACQLFTPYLEKCKNIKFC